MKAKVIEQLRKALKENDELYNEIGNGDISYSQAGWHYNAVVGFETIQALKLALEKLREEN